MLQPIARVVRRHVQGTTLWIEAYVKHRMRDRTRNLESVFGMHRLRLRICKFDYVSFDDRRVEFGAL